MSFRFDGARAIRAEWAIFALLPLAIALAIPAIVSRLLPDLSALDGASDIMIFGPAIIVVAASGLMYLVGMATMVALLCGCKSRCNDHNLFGKALADALRSAATAADTLGGRLRSADTRLEEAANAIDIEIPAMRFRTRPLKSLQGVFSAAPDGAFMIEIDENASVRPFSTSAGHLRNAIDPPTIALSTCADALRNAANTIDP